MKIALTTSHNRVAPCLPGSELWVLEAEQNLGEHQAVSTAGWHPLSFGPELMRRDVRILLCSGIEQFVWGALHGYGIRVVPNAAGAVSDVLRQWREGRLTVPQMWPLYPGVYGGGRGRRRRFRGGR